MAFSRDNFPGFRSLQCRPAGNRVEIAGCPGVLFRRGNLQGCSGAPDCCLGDDCCTGKHAAPFGPNARDAAWNWDFPGSAFDAPVCLRADLSGDIRGIRPVRYLAGADPPCQPRISQPAGRIKGTGKKDVKRSDRWAMGNRAGKCRSLCVVGPGSFSEAAHRVETGCVDQPRRGRGRSNVQPAHWR